MLKQVDGRITGKPLVDISLEDVAMLGAVFGTVLGRRALVVSGRDTAPVSRMLKRALTAGLMSVGCDVMDFHEAVSGEISFSMKRFGAKGGFNIHLNPRRPGYITIRLYKAPGYELVGGGLAEVASREKPVPQEAGEVGWVNYAEYMHELYASALVSFVKSDEISAAKLNIVASHGHGASDEVLRRIFTLLELEYTLMSSGRISGETYPFVKEMGKVAASTRAMRADLGVVFNIDASALAVYIGNLGFLLPEEILLAVLTRYPGNSSVVVDKYVSPSIVRYMGEKGYRVRVAESEEKLIELVRRERPVLALNGRGDFITPLFSLGYDALIAFMQLLEALSLQRSEVYGEINTARSMLTPRARSLSEVEAVCNSDTTCVRTLWGFRMLRERTLHTYIYSPDAGGYIEIVEQQREPSS
ncbi:phosphoglucomutase [Desulfurococcus mucosus]|uniref:Phosphoglucomutase/phosphomannomutase alpha/beta/alpha domain I n=1 Tax=Desulfurococcus mucosus (strain ATCC 35584 / DSM 2162 / JCM 9187 / O7/1) TaxID=765177 RepID=E8R807_DESM0|nr:phosphoglucomutase [Desulfurococcus mucosus]ADV64633.1 phosphoglucomutase/phosphomannomutase alpha/beta/alpha domain I [Desulfurococcus mucosus DSM 2162]